jgi:hypothetical protein
MAGVSSRSVNRVIQRCLAGLVVLTLAVLSPASCLIHCAIMDARRHAVELAFFLCDHGEPIALHAVEMPPMPMPRAFYELLPSLAFHAPLTIVLVFVLALRPAPLPARLRCQPPTPPPR